jgi:hypothetical protein
MDFDSAFSMFKEFPKNKTQPINNEVNRGFNNPIILFAATLLNRIT